MKNPPRTLWTDGCSAHRGSQPASRALVLFGLVGLKGLLLFARRRRAQRS